MHCENFTKFSQIVTIWLGADTGKWGLAKSFWFWSKYIRRPQKSTESYQLCSDHPNMEFVKFWWNFHKCNLFRVVNSMEASTDAKPSWHITSCTKTVPVYKFDSQLIVFKTITLWFPHCENFTNFSQIVKNSRMLDQNAEIMFSFKSSESSIQKLCLVCCLMQTTVKCHMATQPLRGDITEHPFKYLGGTYRSPQPELFWHGPGSSPSSTRTARRKIIWLKIACLEIADPLPPVPWDRSGLTTEGI